MVSRLMDFLIWILFMAMIIATAFMVAYEVVRFVDKTSGGAINAF